jgi:hypothetical protein
LDFSVPVIAHIGNLPVEEWLPFVAPVVALYLYGRHRGRRRRESVLRLPGIEALDQATIERVFARWSDSDHTEVTRDFVPLLYPPGPEGATATELADRIHADHEVVRARLEDLAELGYLELDEREGEGEPRGWLTVSGYDLLDLTEAALLADPPGRPPDQAQPKVPPGQSQENLRELRS